MEVIKRMGVLYGKLGLSTDPAVVEARYQGVVAACDKLGQNHVANLVGSALGLKGYAPSEEFLAFFSEKDPAFDVAPSDKEAALLAASAIAYCFAETLQVEDPIALGLATASFGGIRSAPTDDKLVQLAEEKLAELQTDAFSVPDDAKYSLRGKALTEAIEALEQPPSRQNISTGIQNAQMALQKLGDYAENAAKSAAISDNQILRYLRRLEGEVRVYWWASSGWSVESNQPFKRLDSTDAAIRAGKELADKSHASAVGFFAAPALFSMVLERGRESVPESVSLAKAAVAADRSWRKSSFQAISEGIHANLMPLSTAMGMAASSDDEDDWQPRFERLTGLKVTTELTADQLAIQMYRERLLARVLK